jgi:hypothetical protein
MRATDLLPVCIEAIDAEIIAVKLRPAKDVLFDGQILNRPDSEKGAVYRFRSTQLGLKFAEKITARYKESVYEVTLSDSDEETLSLHLPESVGKTIDRLDVEWENDFVLRRLRDKLIDLREGERTDLYDRIDRVLNPTASANPLRPTSHVPRPTLNVSQSDALVKSLVQPVTYIWGPPGTGKTSTLGHIMAEFMLQGKTVLFVSNTNRAVDVGLLSVIQQLETLDGVYRLGETALEDGRLVDCQFESVVEQTRERMREQISAMQGLISRYDAIRDVDVDAPDPVTVKMKELGGKRKVDADLTKLIDRFASIDYSLLNKSRLMATTLAKVCTSELLDGREFDVVVLDEASMASLPYVLVIAAKSASHMVIAGDPMQLPPISQSEKPEAKTWMETDMYALASGAKTTSDLFAWHDANPEFTCFFDTQYRMPDGLAALISDVFYEGRLITPAKPKKSKTSPIQVIDTSPLGPSIIGKQTNGFQPVNEVHQGVVRDLVVQLVLKHSYSPYDIGIIVPFRSAVWDMRQVLRKDGFTEVEVGTVHTFQGREKKVIIFDTVMSGMGERGQVRHFSVRPFDETKSGLQVPRLLNVAFSRAKEKVFLIADLDHMRKVYPRKFLGKLLGRIIKGKP